MRFRTSELAPSRKRQYLLAVGAKDIEILLGLAQAASASMPHISRESNPQYDEVRSRTRSMIKTLKEARKEAYALEDLDGRRVPWGEFGVNE